MKNIKLTKTELNELVGGVIEDSTISTKGDVENLNQTFGCECTYNNRPGVTNNNTVSGCSCKCWPSLNLV